MLKMDLKFEDFNGTQRSETFYFNMSRREVIELQTRHATLVNKDDATFTGGFQSYVEGVIERGDGKEIADLFSDIILSSYGEKSDDGLYFVKNTEVRQKFQNSAAYDQLYFEMFNDEKVAQHFLTSVFPKPEEEKNVSPAAAHGIKKVEENVSAPRPTDEEIRKYMENQKNSTSE